MSPSKIGTVLAVMLTFVGVAPAFAHKDATDWLAMMERLRQQRASDAYAKEQRAPFAVPQVNKAQPGWRYFGGPRGGMWYSR